MMVFYRAYWKTAFQQSLHVFYGGSNEAAVNASPAIKQEEGVCHSRPHVHFNPLCLVMDYPGGAAPDVHDGVFPDEVG